MKNIKVFNITNLFLSDVENYFKLLTILSSWYKGCLPMSYYTFWDSTSEAGKKMNRNKDICVWQRIRKYKKYINTNSFYILIQNNAKTIQKVLTHRHPMSRIVEKY